jgi:hypothetical protein
VWKECHYRGEGVSLCTYVRSASNPIMKNDWSDGQQISIVNGWVVVGGGGGERLISIIICILGGGPVTQLSRMTRCLGTRRGEFLTYNPQEC